MKKYKDIKDYINENFPQVDSFKGEPPRKVSKRSKKRNKYRKEMER